MSVKFDPMLHAARETALLPALMPAGYMIHLIRLFLHAAILWLVAPQPYSSIDFLRSLTILFTLGELCGIGTCTGPLAGQRSLAEFFEPLRWHLTPGSLAPGLLSQRRTRLEVILFAALLTTLVWALAVAPSDRLLFFTRIAVALLVLLCALDYTTFPAAAGWQYLPTLVCLCHGDDRACATGAQLVQAAQLFWAGLSKIGPFFPAVAAQLTAQAPLSPMWLRRAMFVEATTDLRPSWTACVLAAVGIVGEIGFPALMLYPPTAFAGACLCGLFHAFILVHFPIGSVQEWNLFCLAAVLFLGLAAPHGAGVTFDDLRVLPTPLGIYLSCTMVFVPLAGAVRPHSFSYLAALRQYNGNWPVQHVLVAKTAAHKLDAVLPSWCAKKYGARAKPNAQKGTPRAPKSEKGDRACSRQGLLDVMFPGTSLAEHPHVGVGLEALILRRHLNARAARMVMERAAGSRSLDADFEVMTVEALLGRSCGHDGLLTPRLMRYIASQCDFERGDFLVAEVNSFPTIRRWGSALQCRLVVRDAAVTENAGCVYEDAVSATALQGSANDEFQRNDRRISAAHGLDVGWFGVRERNGVLCNSSEKVE